MSSTQHSHSKLNAARHHSYSTGGLGSELYSVGPGRACGGVGGAEPILGFSAGVHLSPSPPIFAALSQANFAILRLLIVLRSVLVFLEDFAIKNVCGAKLQNDTTTWNAFRVEFDWCLL